MAFAKLQPKLTEAFRLMFPSSCPSCGIETTFVESPSRVSNVWDDDGWCRQCHFQLDSAQAPRCELCAAVLKQSSPYAAGCASCFNRQFPFDGAISVHNYDGLLKHLVLHSKNSKDEILTAQLGRLLGQRLAHNHLVSEADVMLPIPLHWRRRFSRNGFHGSALIAQNVQKITRIAQSRRILTSVKPTKKQGTLSRTARAANVRNAFKCRRPDLVAGRTVVLVDDVMTSGATMSEATRVLKRAGAKKVVVAIVARAT